MKHWAARRGGVAGGQGGHGRLKRKCSKMSHFERKKAYKIVEKLAKNYPLEKESNDEHRQTQSKCLIVTVIVKPNFGLVSVVAALESTSCVV